LLEQADQVGGLAASIRIGENHYGYGTHHLHSPESELIEPFKDLLGSDLAELQRKLSIKFMGDFYPYPLKTNNLIKAMPLSLLVSATMSLFKELLSRRFRRGNPADAEEAIIRLYGSKLYQVLFRDYTTKFWGVPPTQISPTFVDKRMPGINAVEKIKTLLGRVGLVSGSSIGKNVTIGSGSMYTTASGTGYIFESVAEAIKSKGGEVLTSAKAIAVDGADDRIRSVTYKTSDREEKINCDLFISTIPINSLVQSLRPKAPVDVLDSAASIGFRGLIVAAFLVKQKKRLNAMFTYFPDRSFHRLSEVWSPPAKIKPEGASIMLAEFTCNKDDEIWNNPESVKDQAVVDLVDEGYIESKEDVLETNFLKAANAYPKYDIGFERHVYSIESHLKKFRNMVSTGRQGAFLFTPMVPSMQLAWKDTNELLIRCKAGIL